MKLVEILARDLEVWPEFASWATQHETTGEINFDADHGCSASADFSSDIAEDAAYAAVTRPQWQAERDRIMAMDTQQAMASTEPTYEQQLWDRVAFSALGGIASRMPYSNPDEAGFLAAQYADAFMAERAKRVGK